MAELPIPLEALEDCGLILGRRGAGKSATRTLLLEHEIDRGRRCCLIDPKGDSWGIRLNPDGSPSRFQGVYIFGGYHPDEPIDEDMGETLGRLVATHDLSCVIDLSALSIAGMRRFARDFAEALFDHNTQPLTLFVDEADQLAPQPLPRDMTVLLHRMDRLIRQGRHRGIFMWMATQRPQVLHPNLRSQAESLIVMRLTTPLERKAAEEWLEAHDPAQAKEILPTLAKLATGEAWIWVPAADFLERVQLPLFSTFDSMRTPRHGEQVERVSLPPIDKTAIAALLCGAGGAPPPRHPPPAGGIVAGAGAGAEAGRLLIEKDARIRALTEQVGGYQAERHRWEARIRDLEAEPEQLREQLRIYENLVVNVQLAVDDAREEIARLATPAEPSVSAGVGRGEDPSSEPPARPVAGGGEAPKASAYIEPRSASPDSSQRDAAADPEREYRALGILAAALPMGLTEAAWAARAGYSRKGGAWQRRRTRYVQAGFIEKRGSKWFATEQGRLQAGEDLPDFPAPGLELVRFWAKRLGGAAERILLRLAALYPQALNRAAIAGEVHMAEKGGAFGRAISELKSAELVEERGRKLRVAAAIMGGD